MSYDFSYEAGRVCDAIGSNNGRMTVQCALREAYAAGEVAAAPAAAPAPPLSQPSEAVNWEASYHQACNDADAYKADAEKRLMKMEQNWRSCQHEISYLRERLSLAKAAPAPTDGELSMARGFIEVWRSIGVQDADDWLQVLYDRASLLVSGSPAPAQAEGWQPPVAPKIVVGTVWRDNDSRTNGRGVHVVCVVGDKVGYRNCKTGRLAYSGFDRFLFAFTPMPPSAPDAETPK